MPIGGIEVYSRSTVVVASLFPPLPSPLPPIPYHICLLQLLPSPLGAALTTNHLLYIRNYPPTIPTRIFLRSFLNNLLCIPSSHPFRLTNVHLPLPLSILMVVLISQCRSTISVSTFPLSPFLPFLFPLLSRYPSLLHFTWFFAFMPSFQHILLDPGSLSLPWDMKIPSSLFAMRGPYLWDMEIPPCYRDTFLGYGNPSSWKTPFRI